MVEIVSKAKYVCEREGEIDPNVGNFLKVRDFNTVNVLIFSKYLENMKVIDFLKFLHP